MYNSYFCSLESPVTGRHPRDRSISTDSFKMDPEDIERVSLPNTDKVYTVVSRPTKQNEKAQNGGASKRVSSTPAPRYPPPPPPNKKPPQPKQLPNSNVDDEHDYSDVADDLSSPSPEPLSPVHQLSPTNPAPFHSRPVVAPRRSKEDLVGGGDKPRPPTKPAPLKKPSGLAIGKGAGGRPESQLELRSDSPSRSAKSVSPFRGPLSPQHPPRPKSPPKPEQQASAANAKLRHRPSYTEVDPEQEIKVEPLPLRMSATDNDMWVKVKYNSRHLHQDSLGRRSSSSSNLTNTMNSASGSDYYSNLAELNIDPPGSSSTGGSSSQRRHSFTEGEENKLIIKASAANR